MKQLTSLQKTGLTARRPDLWRPFAPLVLAVLFSAFFTHAAFGQNDETELIKRFSKKMQEMKMVKTTFSMTQKNIQDKVTNVQEGRLIFVENSYRLDFMGMETYFDGTTKWQYIPEANEVTVSSPTADESDILSNPPALFRDLDIRFKSRFLREFRRKGRTYCEFEFYPRNLQQPYVSLRLQLAKETLKPVKFRYQSKDGNIYTIDIKTFDLARQAAEQKFVFDTLAHPDIEIVDLR